MENPDFTKGEWQARGGKPVRIFATDGKPGWEILGAIKQNDGWLVLAWNKKGEYLYCHDYDLVPVPKRIKMTCWMNLYPLMGSAPRLHPSRQEADAFAALDRLACYKLEIDVPYGYGLEKDGQ